MINTLIIVDDNLIFRQAIKVILTVEQIAIVIGEASNGFELLDLLGHLKPDVVLMDINMPEMNGIEATQRALALIPDLKIIGLTQDENIEYFDKMVGLGASGFILKSKGIWNLEKAINEVMKGKKYLYDHVQ